ncbi:XRE family transcriptional regulator [Micromonospora sp. WMMD1102]|uniref:XRE family transcriptional regulator n=1 Tax=Micromonospora sp. WMMD1102 TaxID=3016105 RepID=UPI002414D4CF|nr:XRE family transcriptional regulator [Micromonospora sp. WMMD1102]MDG4790160.1 XRE family transcriptional regulator [Micromonospora sp. WMMD1102]
MAPRRRRELPRNDLLRAARLRLLSPTGSGLPMSRRELADAINAYLAGRTRSVIDAKQIGKMEQGKHRWPGALRREAFRVILNADSDQELGFYIARQRVSETDQPASGQTFTDLAPLTACGPDATAITSLDSLRRAVDNAVCTSTMSPASLDDWEEAVTEHGRRSRTRPAALLLDELQADMVDLTAQLNGRHPASSHLRLTHVTARMAGLIFLTLIKLDQRGRARTWARTARIAADEAGDRSLRSWVRAQEAYVHYYSGDLREAVTVAAHARQLAGNRHCVGAALAAALQARAHAVFGQVRETRAALDFAEATLGKLDAQSAVASAFGYNEAQLRFHEGNAYTHLGDTAAAWHAQRTALTLCPAADYLDRALIHLDQAACLARKGDSREAIAVATEAMTALTEQQRTGMIATRGLQIIQLLPRPHRTLPAVAEFRTLLGSNTLKGEADP